MRKKINTVYQFFSSWLLSPACFQLAFVFVVAALPVAFLLPLGSNWEGDSADYRIPFIRWIVRHGSLPHWPWTFIDDYPVLAELLMAPLHAITPALARLVPMAAYLGTALLFGSFLAHWLQRHGEKKWIFWVGACWALSLRPLALQGASLMTDMVGACGIIGVLASLERKSYKGIFLFAALTAAAKYSAWPGLAAMGAALLLVHFSQPRFFLAAALGGLAGALPTLVRNYFVNGGNPFFPLFIRVLGPATAADQSVMHYGQFGRGNSFLDFLLLPYDLVITNSFQRNFYDYVVGKPFLLQIGLTSACTLWLLLRGRRFSADGPEKKSLQFLLVFLLLSTLAWFVTAQQMRFYVVPLLVVQALLMRALLGLGAPRLAGFLGLLCIPGILSIQSEYIKLLRDPGRSTGLSNLPHAQACLSQIPKGTVVGYTGRPGILGFFDEDFVFVPDNPYFAIRSDIPPPMPEFIYGPLAASYQEHYEPWPAENPCAHKRMK